MANLKINQRENFHLNCCCSPVQQQQQQENKIKQIPLGIVQTEKNQQQPKPKPEQWFNGKKMHKITKNSQQQQQNNVKTKNFFFKNFLYGKNFFKIFFHFLLIILILINIIPIGVNCHEYNTINNNISNKGEDIEQQPQPQYDQQQQQQQYENHHNIITTTIIPIKNENLQINDGTTTTTTTIPLSTSTTNLTNDNNSEKNFLREHFTNIDNKRKIISHNHNHHHHHHYQQQQQQIYQQKTNQQQQQQQQKNINNDSDLTISDNNNNDDDDISAIRNQHYQQKQYHHHHHTQPQQQSQPQYDQQQQSQQHNNNNNNKNNDNSNSNTNSNINSNININSDTSYVNSDSGNINGCQACRLREEVKAASLQSIKAHVLQKLRFNHPTNMTILPKVPQIIVNHFYNQSGGFGGDGTTTTTTTNGKTTNNNFNDDNSGNGDDLNDNEHMYGDDPHILRTIKHNYNYNNNNNNKFEPGPEIIEEDDDFYSITDRIYALATITRIRHNRKNADILKFRFNSIQHTIVTKATLNLYINNLDTLRNYDINQLNKIINNNYNYNYNITINRVVVSPLQPDNLHFRNEKEFIGNLKTINNKNLIQIDITLMVNEWFQNILTNNGIVIKISDPLIRKLIIIDDNQNNNENVPFIEIITKDTRKRRTKRNISLNCHENDKENRCCRYPLTVDFEKFGWDWIIAPKRYDANYCRGECTISFLQQYPHTHIMQLSSSAQPCCSPKKMSHLKLLYFDMNYNIVFSHIPNMIVDKCSCS